VQGKKKSERDKNKKIGGEEKTKNNGKKLVPKKKQIFFHNGARENRPMTPTEKALRAALWTTSTSGKALFDRTLNTLAHI